tara:strand:+ start:376 stop:3720 length:3345 start_codon:yes stop_codon:yes gene_type:complete
MSKNKTPKFPDVVSNTVAVNATTVLAQPGNNPPPAAIVGTAVQGPAFVPFDIASIGDFEKVFGSTAEALTNDHYGMLAADRYFKNNGTSVVYFRTLGAGDCKSRLESGENQGRVNNAGFVAGQELINTATNLVGTNPYAGSLGPPGRAYFLAAMMSESNGSTFFSDAGLQTVGENKSVPIVRGVLFSPSGVNLSLNLHLSNYNEPSETSFGEYGVAADGSALDGGSGVGSVYGLKQQTSTFVLVLNGHTSTTENPSAITASFSMQGSYNDLAVSGLSDASLPNGKSEADSMYFPNVFNRDPYKIQEAGHYLYTYYDIPDTFAVVTGSGVITDTLALGSSTWDGTEPIGLLLTSSLSRNAGSATNTAENTIGVPNFENFEDRFSGAFSPFVMSQKIGSRRFDLFRLRSFSDGEGSRNYKFIVSNIVPGSQTEDGYASFDIEVYSSTDPLYTQTALHTFANCSLNPSSLNFISNVVGDRHSFYDFDADVRGRKTVVVGNSLLQTQLVRVEVSKDVLNDRVPKDAVPSGFRGIHHLVTSGSSTSILTGSFGRQASLGVTNAATYEGLMPSVDDLRRTVQPPLPMRNRLSTGAPGVSSLSLTNSDNIPWGTRYERIGTPSAGPVLTQQSDHTSLNLLEFFPSFHTTFQNPWVGDNHGTADVGGTVLDADRYNNNMFTLERIAVITGSSNPIPKDPNALLPDYAEWPAAVYIRNGKLPSSLYRTNPPDTTDKVRFIDPAEDLKDDLCRKFLKFCVPMLGGFDGLNLFDEEGKKMSDTSIYRERYDTNISGKSASSTAAYNAAINILKEKSEADMSVFAVPGIRHRAVIDTALEAAQSKFDCLFISDIEQYDSGIEYVTTGSSDSVDLSQTVTKFVNRTVDNSFGAAYFPDVKIGFDLTTPVIKSVPPTVAALGVIARSDDLASPHAAPMGYTRGRVLGGNSADITFSNSDKQFLIDANINPIIDDMTNVEGLAGEDENLSGVCVISQSTMLDQESSLGRVNIRRLLITVRRNVRNIARGILFAKNNSAVIEVFRRRVHQYLSGLKGSGHIDSFEISILPTYRPPTTTNIQTNVDRFKPFGGLLNRSQDQETEAKTIRGAVMIRPVASDEMIKIDVDESI